MEPSTIPAEPIDNLVAQLMIVLLPFFLDGADGDGAAARMAILQMIDSYQTASARELHLVGRIIAFGSAAMDSLHRSMADPDMTEPMRLRYRSNAIALSRSAEMCQKTLDGLRQRRLVTPAEATPPPPEINWTEHDIEAVRQEARSMMADFQANRPAASASPLAASPSRPPAANASARHPAEMGVPPAAPSFAPLGQPDPRLLEAMLQAASRIVREPDPSG